MTQPSIANLRRRSAKLGYRFHKWNRGKGGADNLGGYQIVDISMNAVVQGSTFDLDLEDVASFIEEQERQS